MLCDEADSKSKSPISSILSNGQLVWKDCFVVFTALWFPYVILSPNLVIVQTS